MTIVQLAFCSYTGTEKKDGWELARRNMEENATERSKGGGSL